MKHEAKMLFSELVTPRPCPRDVWYLFLLFCFDLDFGFVWMRARATMVRGVRDVAPPFDTVLGWTLVEPLRTLALYEYIAFVLRGLGGPLLLFTRILAFQR